MHFDQLAQWCVQRLLGNAQVAQQFLDAQVGIAGDKEQDAVMHADRPRRASISSGFAVKA